MSTYLVGWQCESTSLNLETDIVGSQINQGELKIEKNVHDVYIISLSMSSRRRNEFPVPVLDIDGVENHRTLTPY